MFGRLAGYEDVNDADRFGRDPAMHWIVGGKAVERGVRRYYASFSYQAGTWDKPRRVVAKGRVASG